MYHRNAPWWYTERAPVPAAAYLREEAVTITCTTIEAAAQVLAVLIDARLVPSRDFRFEGSYPRTPPITFTLLAMLPAYVLGQLRAIDDTTIT